MPLQDILETSAKKDSLTQKKLGFSRERVMAQMPIIRQYIAFFREYPDIFLDFIQGEWRLTDRAKVSDKKRITLDLYAYQRIFLRAIFRHKYVYGTFPRAYSKSFLTVLSQILRAILYPNSQLFVTAGGKEQSANILKDKENELIRLVPALAREIKRERGGGTTETKDYVRYQFTNGSVIDNITASEKSRGLRRTAGTIEECIGVDGDILSTVIIPIMNISRRCGNGKRNDQELINKSQVFITTAGFKNTFSYDKLIQLLIWMVTDPDKAFVMGGTYRIPVLAGLQDGSFIQDLKRDGSFNEEAFQREYENLYSINSINCGNALRAV